MTATMAGSAPQKISLSRVLGPAHVWGLGVGIVLVAALHLLAGAGHIPQIECPDRVAQIIQRMIHAVAGSG